VSVSTVGFGDYCLQKDASKIIASFYLIIGCGLFASLVGMIAAYQRDSFEYQLMQNLLMLKHDSERIGMFDEHCSGEVTSGDFLMGYLVTLGMARRKTMKEIMCKFKDLSLGKRYIDIVLFTARQEAIRAGRDAGMQAAAEIKARGEPPHVQAEQAGKVAADEAKKVLASYKLNSLSASEQLACAKSGVFHGIPDRKDLQVIDLPGLCSLESAVGKVLSEVRVAKNEATKIALAAGIVAGAVCADCDLDKDKLVEISRRAAKDAGGDEYVQKTAAARAVREAMKKEGAAFRQQSLAAQRVFDDQPVGPSSQYVERESALRNAVGRLTRTTVKSRISLLTDCEE